MVTRQILVLKFQVRALVEQQLKKSSLVSYGLQGIFHLRGT